MRREELRAGIDDAATYLNVASESDAQLTRSRSKTVDVSDLVSVEKGEAVRRTKAEDRSVKI